MDKGEGWNGQLTVPAFAFSSGMGCAALLESFSKPLKDISDPWQRADCPPPFRFRFSHASVQGDPEWRQHNRERRPARRRVARCSTLLVTELLANYVFSCDATE